MDDGLMIMVLFGGVLLGFISGVILMDVATSRNEISNGCIVYKNTLYCEKESE